MEEMEPLVFKDQGLGGDIHYRRSKGWKGDFRPCELAKFFDWEVETH